MTDKRQFTRLPLEGSATISDRDALARVRLLDLSLKGALTERPLHWRAEIDSPCKLTIALDGVDTPVVMECRVAHLEPGHIGFQCLSIDIESISFLRRMVELNTGDPMVLERELSALG